MKDESPPTTHLRTGNGMSASTINNVSGTMVYRATTNKQRVIAIQTKNPVTHGSREIGAMSSNIVGGYR